MSAENNKIWINGQAVAVNDAVYAAYMQGDRKNRYFENDLKVERIIRDEDNSIKEIIPSREDSLDRLMDDNAAQYADGDESVEDAVFRRITAETLYAALEKLPVAERTLMIALYFEGKTERELAMKIGISQPAVHKKKNKILKKLKVFLEN